MLAQADLAKFLHALLGAQVPWEDILRHAQSFMTHYGADGKMNKDQFALVRDCRPISHLLVRFAARHRRSPDHPEPYLARVHVQSKI